MHFRLYDLPESAAIIILYRHAPFIPLIISSQCNFLKNSLQCNIYKPPGAKSRMCLPYPKRIVKGDSMGRFLGMTILKCWPRVGAFTGTFKNPAKWLWRWEPDRRSNFFSPPVHLCTVAYITEISLHVTLSNQSHSLNISINVYMRIWNNSFELATWWTDRSKNQCLVWPPALMHVVQRRSIVVMFWITLLEIPFLSHCVRGSYDHFGCPVELKSHKSKLTEILLSNQYFHFKAFKKLTQIQNC